MTLRQLCHQHLIHSSLLLRLRQWQTEQSWRHLRGSPKASFTPTQGANPAPLALAVAIYIALMATYSILNATNSLSANVPMHRTSQCLDTVLTMVLQMQEASPPCEEAAVLPSCRLCQMKEPQKTVLFPSHPTWSGFVQRATGQQLTICDFSLCTALIWVNNSRPAQCWS